MDWQQITAFGLVAAAAVYLGRSLVQSARRLFTSKSGCGEGCSRCSYAPPATAPERDAAPIISMSQIGTFQRPPRKPS